MHDLRAACRRSAILIATSSEFAKEARAVRRISWLIVTLGLVGIGGTGWYLRQDAAPAVSPPRPPAPAIAVRATRVERRNVPIFLSGIGTAQAFNVVTVKARVDGHLDRVAFVEGQDVAEGEVLAEIDARPFRAQLAQARATKARDEALLANARLDLERTTALATREYATRQTLDTQRALVAQLEASIQGDQATIDSANVQVDYTTIRSPISGRTGMRLVDKGNIVHATDTNGLVVITQLQPISVVLALPQDVLVDVTKAQSAGPLKVVAYNRDGTTRLDEGVLAVVDNQVDAATGTIRLKATFENRSHVLWPGQFVNARLLLTVRNDVATVPAQVIQRGPAGLFAYVIKPDQTVEQRAVRIGYSRDGVSVVEEGLAAEELVVLDGQYKLRAGARVQVAPAGAPPRQVSSASVPGATP
jgi:multidrug efflux system membrane fusion protein